MHSSCCSSRKGRFRLSIHIGKSKSNTWHYFYPSEFVSQDVIGAAETGSGKTLAFGLPILQRLLEEQEKANNLVVEKGEAVEKNSPRSLLRALIITPTRELALQVFKSVFWLHAFTFC